MVAQRLCDKQGCIRVFTHTIILQAGDGNAVFRACAEHAAAFHAWCLEQAAAQQEGVFSLSVAVYEQTAF